MQIDFSRVTDKNYKEIIEKCQPLIGKIVKPYNLPIIDIVAMNFQVLDEVYENILTMKHSQNPKDWKIMSLEKFKEEIEKLKTETWPQTFLKIMAFFRDENTGRVYIDYLEYVL